MYFNFQCPHCGKNLKIREELAGRRVACPYCKTAVAVPPPTPDESDVDDDSAGDPSAPPEHVRNLDQGNFTGKRAGRTKSPSQATRPLMLSRSTDVSMIRCGVIGLVIATLFMLLMLPLSGVYLGELFWHRGWVPFVLTLLMGWSVAILALKSRKIAKQKASMILDVLPTELGEEITTQNLGQFIHHIKTLPVTPQDSFLVTRVRRGLEHFRVRQSNPEVAGMLASQSEIDATHVESSYTLLKVFIWAIPILGFIGTVIGISAAVSSFSGSMDEAAEISELKQSLNLVTGGLATAFDTTLIALVMSMLVMFPASAMQKTEEDLLNWVDEYCNENLLKRLNDGGGELNSGDASAMLRRAVYDALGAHHAQLDIWTKKLESIGSTLTAQVVEGWGDINEQLKNQHDMKVAQLRTLDKMIDDFQQSYVSGFSGLNQVLRELGEKQIIVQQAPRRRMWPFGRNDAES